jgi:hypothetical protein
MAESMPDPLVAELDPLVLFPKDAGGLLGGLYRRVAHDEIERFAAAGWERVPLTDGFFHPMDEHGIMMRWREERGAMVLPPLVEP